MRQAWLLTQKSTIEGTFGKMICDTGWCANSGELPWRWNQPKFSCIPEGDYDCKIVDSPRFGLVYQVLNVSGRSFILEHPANYVGDVKMGKLTQLEGCIALGEKVGIMGGQKALLVSRPAVRRFMEEMNKEPFKLHVVSLTGERTL